MKIRTSITTNENYTNVFQKMFSGNVSDFVEHEMQRYVIERICSENMLYCDFENADITESEEKSILKKRYDYNCQLVMPRPTVEQLQLFIDKYERFELAFDQCLYFAIAQFWAQDCFNDEKELVQGVSFYLETWL